MTRMLCRSAIRAHRRGDRWATFFAEHGDAIRAAEPYDRQRYNRLVRRLLALVASGDTDGMKPIDAEPWQGDNDQAKPDDTATAARCKWGVGG